METFFVFLYKFSIDVNDILVVFSTILLFILAEIKVKDMFRVCLRT